MKTRIWKRALAALLCVVMVIAMVPGMAFAADSASSSDTNFRIVHLDCGRKYFSVANIEKLIDTMAQYGYNQLQLAFGNGGCRFLLDDMSLSFGDVTMTSDTVKSNITAGNNAFNGDTRYLTEDNMDEIIAYANSKGIDVVPMLNMPGHASAIVYNTSYTDNGNLNVANETAREYGYALLSKYVDYFDAQGCSYFHFGADESGYTGTNMSTFLAGCAEVITGAGMTPRAFNDATAVATMPTSVQITYWHAESGSSTASALDNAGYGLINTHGRWYYVIKNAQNSEIGTKYWQGTVNTNAVSVELPVMKAEKMDNYWVGINEFFDYNPGYGSTISDSLGTMFCIWCDQSEDTYLTDSDVISTNENYGALYQLQKMAEHYWPEDINTDSGDGDGSTDTDTTTVTITAASGAAAPSALVTGGSAILTVGESATWTSSNENVISLASADESAVALLSAELTATNVTANAVGAGTATITATTASGTTDTLDVTVSEPGTQTVNIEVGESVTFDTTATAGDYITDDNQYIATANVTVVAGTSETTVSTTKATELEDGATYIIRVYNTAYALSTNTGSNAWGTQTLAFESNTLTANEDHMWTLEAADGGYKLKSADGYLNLGTGNNTAYVDTTGEVFTITSTTTGWTIGNQSGRYINALGGLENYYSAGGWTGDGTRFDLYKVTTATEGSTTLTITGTGEGTTTATVGGVVYTINVTAPSTTENKSLTHNDSLTLPAGAADIEITSGSNIVALNDEGTAVTSGETDGEATVTFVTKNEGGYVTARYTYTITVAAVDLSGITLNVELWVTDRHVVVPGNIHETQNNSSDDCNDYEISAVDAYGEAGVLLSSLIPFNSEDEQGNPVMFWKGTQLTSENKQGHNDDATKTGDKSDSGNDFEKIRYYDNSWWYYSNNTWTQVNSTDQIVAYYMQVYATSPEITTAFKDYGGLAGNGAGEDESPFTWATAPTGLFGVGTAVVYSDRSMAPADDEAIWNTTLQLQYAYGEGSTPGRIVAYNTDNYRITKITITRGYHADSDGNLITTIETTWNRDDQVLWNKVTDEDGATWYDETVIWTATEGQDQSSIVLDNTVWGDTWVTTSGNNEAFLLLFYVEPVEQEDSLEIIYWDDTDNCQINPNDVLLSVKDGVTFYNIDQTSTVPSADGTFTLDDDATIENSAGVDRTINKDITILDGVDSRYKTGIYDYISAEIADDGKTLILHYGLNSHKLAPLYVIDFALPVQFTLGEVIENPEDVAEIVIGNGTYGALVLDENSTTFTKTTTLTYTPSAVLLGTDGIRVTFTLKDDSVISQNIGFMPASNVLYEEGFMTAGSGWTGTGSKLNDTPASGDGKQDASNAICYGYDAEYVSETALSGSAFTATVRADSTKSGALTFNLSGSTGLDIIGNAGPETANLFVILKSNTAGVSSVIRIIDTQLDDTTYGTLYQVPLAHIEGLNKNASYSVSIYAGYNTSKATAVSTASVGYGSSHGGSSIGSAYAVLYEIAEELGLTADEIDSAEFVSFEDSYSGAYAVSTASTSGTSYVDQTLTIDGFRVYRPTTVDVFGPVTTDNQFGVTGGTEYGLTYVNIISAASEVTDATGAAVIAYVEPNDLDKDADITKYESYGGPENEVYLKPGQSIALKSDNTWLQVSLRSVTGTEVEAVLATSASTTAKSVTIEHSTEMYYTVDAATGIITITNNSTSGLLAVGNAKLYNAVSGAAVGLSSVEESDSSTVYSLLTLPVAAVEDDAEEESSGSGNSGSIRPSGPVRFVPDELDLDVKVITLFGQKYVTVVVNASTDVAKLTINGAPVWAVNHLSVQLGLEDEYVFTKLLVVPADEVAVFEIVAYDKNGLASRTYTIFD